MMDEREKIKKDDANSVTEKQLQEENQSQTGERTDFFTELMFGRSRNNREREQQNDQLNQDVDYFQLMEQIDSIMESVKQLKPLLKPFSPIIDFIKKKI